MPHTEASIVVNRPADLLKGYRTGRYQFDGRTLHWEYPRRWLMRAALNFLVPQVTDGGLPQPEG